MNLPNGLTVGRIAATPLIAALPFAASWTLRLSAFVLFTAAAITDYIDGRVARSRKQETELGRMLDPIADKLLLLGTFIPMFLLASSFPFVTPVGRLGLPWWIVALVLGREFAMTIFRQIAARRGVVISPISAAKWKTAFQLIWQGTAYFWFFAASLAVAQHWNDATAWRAFANFNGLVGAAAMVAAVGLTIYSLVLYARRFSSILTTSPARQSS